eukprot:m.71889 g.71889  ORF g.71889 m.71889 type:complete len:245 (+) comp14387_c0_seq1:104-838(+)
MASPEHVTRVMAKVSCFLLFVSMFFYAIALSSYNWSYQLVNTDAKSDPFFGRGLTSAFTDNGFGVYTVYPYYVKDDNGDVVDPFCGSDSASNIYDFSFGVINVLVWTTRKHDTHNWCAVKNACIGLTAAALLFTTLSLYLMVNALRKGESHLFAALLCGFTGMLSLTTLALYATWMSQEQNDIDTRDIPQEGKMRIGWGLGLVTGGTLINNLIGIAFLSQRWLNGSKRAVLPMATPASGPGSAA